MPAKKNGEIDVFNSYVLRVFKAINAPNIYEPLSPKNILAFGKLNNKNDITIIICANKIIEILSFWLDKFIIRKIEFIIKKWIARSPLKPSTKLAPLIINKKHNNTKHVWNILFSSHRFKNSKPDLVIWIEKKLMQNPSRKSIKTKRIFGLIFIFISSKKPKKNNKNEIVK